MYLTIMWIIKKNGYDLDFANSIGAGYPGIRFDGDCMIVDRVRKLLCKLCMGETFVILFIVNGPCSGVGFSVTTLYNMYYIYVNIPIYIYYNIFGWLWLWRWRFWEEGVHGPFFCGEFEVMRDDFANNF